MHIVTIKLNMISFQSKRMIFNLEQKRLFLDKHFTIYEYKIKVKRSEFKSKPDM